MKIYCFYGIDVPTERSYYYAVMDDHEYHNCTYPDNTTACAADQTAPKSTVTKTVTTPHPARTPLLVRAHTLSV